MISNANIYKVKSSDGELPWTPPADFNALLAQAAFTPCGPTQAQSFGWVPPRGIEHAPLVEVVGGHYILKLMTEQRVLPGAVVNRRVDEVAKKIEDETGRKPGKKQKKEIKEQVELELLPHAFPRQSSTTIWIDPAQGFVVVDAPALSKADEAMTALIKSLDGQVVLSMLQTKDSPAALMSHWLVSGEPPVAFTVDRECELQSVDEMKSVVRYSRHLLDIEEVRSHIKTGKVPTKLAMTWEGRVSFVLTPALQLRKISFLDVVFESSRKAPSKDEAFDADVAIMTGELSKLLPHLIESFGGEGSALQPAASEAA